jgi:large subunit ribosomal protein L25
MKGERIELNVENRVPGKATSRGLRRDRKVPAVLYGAKKESLSISLEEGAVLRYRLKALENALFALKSGDTKLNNVVVLMKEVNVHPVTRRPIHVDLLALDLTQMVRVPVEIRLEGKAIGLAEGGLLNQVVHKVEIECLPTDIPTFISVDVSHLGLKDSMHVSDLKLPEGVKAITAGEVTICVVNEADEEVVAAPTAAAAAAPAAGAAAPAAGAAAPAGDAKAAAPAKDKK